MILDRKPLSLSEVKEILEGVPENEKKLQMETFLKHFMKIKPERSKKIKEDIEKLDMLKIKNSNIIKIADIVPEDASDLNKIFTDVSLTEDETKKILDIIKSSK